MTAKQYLSQAYRLNERINSDLSELDRLRDLATSLSSVNYDGIRVSSTRSTEAPFEKTICKIIDAEKKINAEIDRLVDLKAEISGATMSLLLKYRYRYWSSPLMLTFLMLNSNRVSMKYTSFIIGLVNFADFCPSL